MGISLKGVNLGYMGLDKSLLVEKPEAQNVQFQCPAIAYIIEHPDEDASRLIFADWLDEHDQPERAEFIRLQCQRARAPADHPDQETWPPPLPRPELQSAHR